MRRMSNFLVVFLALTLGAVAFAGVPKTLHFVGALDTGGTPVTADLIISFTLYTDPTSTDSNIWKDVQIVGVTEGRFQVEFTGISDSMLSGLTLFLGIQVGTDPEMSPRIKLTSVPFARYADNALALDGKVPADFAPAAHSHTAADLENPSCVTGQLLSWGGSNWTCANDVNTDVLASLNCLDGQIVRWTGNAWSCTADTDTTIPNTDVLAGLNCADGQIAKWTGNAWGCTADADTHLNNAQVRLAAVAEGFVTGAHTPISTSNTVIVSATGGDYTGLKVAVSAKYSWCPNASATNRCLIRLMPGEYVLDNNLVIPSYTDVVGQGVDNTVISRAGGCNNGGGFKTDCTDQNSAVLKMSDQTTLQNLTIKNSGDNGVSIYSTGIYAKWSSFKLDRVAIEVTGASSRNRGIVASYHQGLHLNDSTIKVHETSGSASNQYGVYIHSASPPAEMVEPNVTVKRTTVVSSGDDCENYGLWLQNTKTNLIDSTIKVEGTGGNKFYGIYNYANGIYVIERTKITSNTFGLFCLGSGGFTTVLSSRISGLNKNTTGGSGATFTCVDSYNALTNAPLAADCSDSTPVTQLTESEVEGFVTNGSINLATGSQVNGVAISTGAHTTDTNTQLTNVEVKAAALAEGFVTGAHTTYTAASSGGLQLTGTSFSLDTNGCVAGEVLKRNASNTDWECVADSDTAYTGDKGVSLVGNEFSADTSFVQKRVLGFCSAGKSIRVISSVGTVTCETDTDTTRSDGEIESVVAGAGYIPGDHTAISTANTAIVSASGGDYTTLYGALSDYFQWCSGATPTNRCVIRLMPGTHVIEQTITLMENLEIVGLGQNNTVISAGIGNPFSTTLASAVVLRPNTSLRQLTLINVGDGQKYSTGIGIDTDGTFELDRVNIQVSNTSNDPYATNYGVHVASSKATLNITDSAILLEEGTGTYYNRALWWYGAAGSALDVKRSTIIARGINTRNYGLYTKRNTTLTDVTITTEDGVSNYGVYINGEKTLIDRSLIVSDDDGVYRKAGAADVFTSRITGAVSNVPGSVTCYNSYDGANYAALSSYCQ